MNKRLAVLAAISTMVATILAVQTETFRWVDAGGLKLRMSIVGNGSPTVVFDTGGGGSLELWGNVPLGVSRFTRTITYDRGGNGLSGKSSSPRDARNIATELHTALRNANQPPPYILVGHSLGGMHMRVFAGMYPNEVAGLVLVDPTQEETQEWATKNGFALPTQKGCTPDSERNCLEQTIAQVGASLVPPNIPVFLIHVMFPWPQHPFPSKALDEVKRTQTERVAVRLKFHQEWIDAIAGAKLIITKNSSHGGINFEEPELVIRTIVEALEFARRTKD